MEVCPLGGPREGGGVGLLRFGGYCDPAGVGVRVRLGFPLRPFFFSVLGYSPALARFLAPRGAVVAGTALEWCTTQGSLAGFWTFLQWV